ncbi:hypothetical protein, partial [Arthrobacter sp.]|uniref:hypothetical protein n=1 Tax=Arthrobacter sp. TaxID=1667 RepID=UPI00289C59A0
DWYQLSSVRERLRSLEALAQERRRLLGSADPMPDPGRDPEKLQAQAERIRAEAAELEAAAEDREGALEDAVEIRAAAEE